MSRVPTVLEANPHAAFTLLRAYLELVALVFSMNDYPGYLAALEKPMSELPKGARKRFAELFEFAAPEMPGIRAVYALLVLVGLVIAFRELDELLLALEQPRRV